MGSAVQITLAHSPDPDDVFMWWPITGMIEPPRDAQAVEPARVVSEPEIDTGQFRFLPIAADISALNRRAIERADIDITAISINCYAHVRDRYRLTSFGSSMGYGYGPKIVGRAIRPPAMASSVCYAEEMSLSGHGPSTLLEPGALVAVPGRQTTAFLLLSMMLGEDHSRLRTVEIPFDRILEAVRSGQNGVTHGLLIHQSQLTFVQHGLNLVADVGQWWLARTGLPLPLGGNAVRRDLDARLGPGTTQQVAGILSRSIRYALKHRERSLEYCGRFAPEITRAQSEAYIEMYVNDLTIDAGDVGQGAVSRLLSEGHHLGLCPDPGKIDMLRPEEFPTGANGDPKCGLR